MYESMNTVPDAPYDFNLIYLCHLFVLILCTWLFLKLNEPYSYLISLRIELKDSLSYVCWSKVNCETWNNLLLKPLSYLPYMMTHSFIFRFAKPQYFQIAISLVWDNYSGFRIYLMDRWFMKFNERAHTHFSWRVYTYAYVHVFPLYTLCL